MAGFYNLDHKEVIRIKVKKCDGRMQPEYKKFSIDPQITSFEMLQGILARAFEINSDFTISYLARDSEGQAVYLSMLSDWDMDAAFQCAADPCLKLKVDLRPFEEELEDWDVIAPAEIPRHRISSLVEKGSILGSITGTITQNIGKTMNTIQRTMGLKQSENEVIKPIKSPMSDMEFHNYLDNAGHMVKPNEFRLSIYQGGIEPSLRRVAWRHLLNIFPANMSGRDRFNYMKGKEEEYRRLRDEWRDKFRNNTATEEVKYVASMVKKDVLRTDRSHGFYAGNDENENTLSLFHILVTYALTHPDVSYCQGMSDVASPLLVTQKDEGQAYICFCALMCRLRENFTVEGETIMTKFRHLSLLVSMYDPVLQAYLVESSAGDMFFCYRWFLLELKREFPFTDALYVLEVMWATLPPSPPHGGLTLVDPDYSSRLLSSSPCSPTFSFQHAMYAKLLAMRRVGALHRIAQAAIPVSQPHRPSANNKLSTEPQPPFCNGERVNMGGASFDTSPGDIEDHSADFPEVDNIMTRSLQKKSNSIDQVLQEGSVDSGEDVREDSDGGKNDENSDEQGSEEEEMESCTLHENSYKDMFDVSSQSHTLVCGHNHIHDNDDRTAFTDSVEETSQFHFNDLDHCKRSRSVGSSVSESSGYSEQQIQFTLSLDSNTNNSGENMPSNSVPEKGPRINLGARLERKNSQDTTTTSSESNSGIFQSMKRLLTSPKRQKSSNSTNDNSVSSSSPKRELIGRHTASASVLSPPSGNEAALGLTKNYSDSQISQCIEATESLDSSMGSAGASSPPGIKSPVRNPAKLPPPQEFGAGNPFLMFLSFTLLTMHRDTIIHNGMCYEEIAMHFDRLVRRHNAKRVLHLARQMYTEYLRAQQIVQEKETDKDELGFSC